jgi:diguanylate cyclase
LASDPKAGAAGAGEGRWRRAFLSFWRDIAAIRTASADGHAAMRVSLRRLRQYEFYALGGFLVAGAVGVLGSQHDAQSVAVAARAAAEAQTEGAVLWQLAALDPRAPDESVRFSAALGSLAMHEAVLEANARSRDVPEALRNLMLGQGYALSERVVDQIALGRRLAASGAAESNGQLLADFRDEIANSLAPRVDQAGQLFRTWANDRADAHSRAIAWTGGAVLGLAVLIALAFLPFEFRLRRNVTLLEWLASRDALTGALGRPAFQARLGVLLGKARPNAGVGVIRFDLDNFRTLNAENGDDAGDATLYAVGSRLRHAVGDDALVGRLGSDSFIVARPEVADGHAGLASEANRLLRAVVRPVAFGERLLRISVSVGTALAPQDSRERSELLRMSEDALRDAKRAGKNRVCAYRTDKPQLQARRDVLLDALANDDLHGLEPWLQPIIDCRRGAAVRLEVNARWNHPKLGRIAADEFLPLADAMGKLPRVSATVRHAAFAALAEIDQALGGQAAGLGLSLNFSAAEISMPEVLPAMDAALKAADIDISRISVELNEDSLWGGGNPAALKFLQELHRRGVSLYVDNFGASFGCLSNLSDFPLDALKIARPFVDGIGRTPGSAAMVRGVIGLAHGLGVLAVAQGVESAVELDFVREAGCDLAQGYFIAPPMSPRAAMVWLQERRQFEQPA